jgi:hypothetical protein
MHKELLIVGVVSMLGLLLLFVGHHSITGALIDESYEVYEIGTETLKNAPQHYPRFAYLPLGKPSGLSPPKAYLTPAFLSLQVDRIPIAEPNYIAFIPLKKDRIHTFSGSAGYYREDPRPHLTGHLCSYAYKIMGAPLRCEQVLFGYIDDKITWAVGKAPGEYVGYQAAGTDFAIVFLLTNPEYGIIASGPIAYLRWVS